MRKRQKYPPTKCVGVDIDGTLVRDGRLNNDLVTWVRARKADGFDVILWSARGRVYAERVAERFKITDCFTAIIGKPGFIVDDQGWGWTKYCRVVRNIRESEDGPPSADIE